MKIKQNLSRFFGIVTLNTIDKHVVPIVKPICLKVSVLVKKTSAMQPSVPKYATNFKLQAASLLFALCTLNYALAQQYGWTDISASLPDYPYDTVIINNGADTVFAHISDISFINDYKGWVTTWHAFSDQNAAILHTTDGGGTWEVQTVMRPCQVIHMIDENVGFAGSDGGLIFKTVDGGINWVFHGITGAPITGMSFPPGSDTGYVCSYANSKMHQITPEGVNVINFDNAPFWWKSISAPSHELIWLSMGTSVYTFDQEGLTDQPITSACYNSIAFAGNQLGWGCGYEGVKNKNEGVIAGCIGRNISWVHLQYTEVPLNDVFVLDENHVWAVGSDGYIYFSDNASDFGFDTLTSTGWSNVVFTSQSNPRPEADFRSVFFSSVNNGFASARNNTLLKYSQVTGVEEQEGTEARRNGGMKVWPNPTRGKFKVQSSDFKVEFESLELVDIYGKTMELSNPGTIGNTGTLELEISHLPAGFYFVRVSFDNQMIVKKIVKL
jgi:hypothetical protein